MARFYYKECLLFGVVTLGVYFLFEDFAALKLNSADASTYLNIAENLVSHKGCTVSYNLYQSFTGLYHPVWPYIQPLYPCLCFLVFLLKGGIEEVIKVNIFILGLNAALVFYIIRSAVPTLFNFLVIFFLISGVNFFYPALYPWTEQPYFFCFLISFILFWKYKDRYGPLLGLGVLNGVLMLIRPAHAYNFLAYFPVIFIGHDPLLRKLKKSFLFAGGFILFYGLYQVFCLLYYHHVYPEYGLVATSYGLAKLTDGVIYAPGKVGIQVFLGPFFTWRHFSFIIEHLKDFLDRMPFFLWPAMSYYFLPIEKRRDGGLVLLCLSQSICTVLGYSLTFYWLPSAYFESLRYSMVPFVLMCIAGWYCLYQGLSLLGQVGKKILLIILVGLLYAQVDNFVEIKAGFWKHPAWEKPDYRNLLQAYHWIDKNLPKEILVASDQDQQGYFMHRPFISTPPGRSSFNCKNLNLFNRIYAPDYYLMSRPHEDKCFTAIPHTEIFSNPTFRLLKVIKS